MTGHPAALFDAHYYRTGCGLPYERSEHWLTFFGQIADNIVQRIGPRSVLDCGCAMGFLVEALRQRGVEAYGFDISPYAIERVADEVRPYCWVGSVLDPLPRRCELLVCIEVLEHLPQADSERALANLCAGGDDILFSSTPGDLDEPTHFNVQPPEYWSAQFARHGLLRDVDFDAGFITPWAMRLRRANAPLTDVVASYERAWWREAEARRAAERALEESRVEMAALTHRLNLAESAVETMSHSLGWQLSQALAPVVRVFAPPGGRRHRLLQRVLRALRR
jgi:SAM-dependent methyltransferase